MADEDDLNEEEKEFDGTLSEELIDDEPHELVGDMDDFAFSGSDPEIE